MMNILSKSFFGLVLMGSLILGPVHAQRGKIDASNLEGVTLKNGASSILVLTNASIQKTGNTNRPGVSAASKIAAPTLLKKIGAYEIHQATVSESARIQARGQSLPAFAQMNAGSAFVGVAYLNDVKDIGLISKDVAARFKDGQVPEQYKSRNPKELIKGTGLYIFAVTDIYDWIKLVSRLQADPEVSLVEPQIKTNFMSPR